MSATVLHVLEAFAGGTERHLVDLIRHAGVFEHVVAVPSTHLGKSTAAAVARVREAGATVELIEMRRSPSPLRNAAALLRLRRLIGELGPDLIHGHSSIGGGFARLAALGSGKPVIYTPNGIRRGRWVLAGERLLGRFTDRLIAVSAGEADFARGQGLIGGERVVVIPNGIALEPPAPLSPTLRERLRVPADAPFMGSLGRLTWQKAPEVYVAACAIVGASRPDAHFVLIGEGPEEASVRRLLAGSGIGERFHWVSALEGAAAAFAELDVYVLASRFEGGPYTVLEAMRAGVPVVATAAEGSRDTVVDGVTGILVPVDDVRALAEAVTRLLRDSTERAAMGAAGRDRLADRYDVCAMGAATASLYQELAGSPADALADTSSRLARA